MHENLEKHFLLTPPETQHPIERILANDELSLRPSKDPDFKAEAETLLWLSDSLAENAENILQKLSEAALKLCQADSAGVSIAEIDTDGKEIFRWRGVSGQLSPFLMGTMPRDFSPCGHVVKTGSHHLMVKMIGHYPYVNQLGIPLYEVLLVPFYANGKAVGTMWIVAHSDKKKFDTEDLRLLTSLTRFASAGYQAKVRFEEETKIKHQIQNERENFRNLFKQMPELVCIVSGPDHVFEFVNAAHIKVLGFDATGMAVRVAQPESVEIHGILDDVFNTGITANLHEIPVTVTDRLRYFNLTYAARKAADGTVIGVMIIGDEVTETVLSRQRLVSHAQELESAKAEAIRANESKSIFLANMSHEIRSPLGAIIGFSEVLRRPELSTAERNNYLRIIDRNSTQLLRVIDDILDLAKVEAGKMTIEQIDFSLTEMLADFASIHGFKARENGIRFEISAETSLPEKIVSDPVRVRQILNNVVGNALKFTSAGSVSVKVGYQDSILSFEVTDTGRGISPIQASELFKPFTQADPSTTRKFGGTGLGLVLTRNLCTTLGGDFELTKSALGEGSTFRATLKVAPFEGTQILEASKVQFKVTPARTMFEVNKPLLGVRILLVEDSLDNQMLIQFMIQNLGGEIIIASNGKEGVERALAENVDLILMDIQMPEMDGHQAVQTLRAKGFKTPIIALTAHAMKEEIERAKISGFSGYVTKPIEREKLVETALGLLS